MLSSCSNPACCTEIKYINAGTLYTLEKRSVATEFFWLCPECGPLVSLFLNPTGSVSIRPRTASRRQPPHPDGDLRLVAGSAEATPWHWSSLAGESTYSSRGR